MQKFLSDLRIKCYDFTDLGFELTFGHCTPTQNYPGMDTNLNDIFINMASWGKEAIAVKLDYHQIKDKLTGKLNTEELGVLIDTCNEISALIEINEYSVLRVFVKVVDPRRSRSESVEFKTIQEAIESVAKQNQSITGREGKGYGGISYTTEIRIHLTGQPLKFESMNESNIGIHSSDLAQLQGIVYDFSSDLKDDSIPVDCELGVSKRNPKNRSDKTLFIGDRSDSYDGFSWELVKPLIIKIMDFFKLEQIEFQILWVFEPGSRIKTLSKEDVLNYKCGPISMLWIYFDIN
jgi:hypothetical protein